MKEELINEVQRRMLPYLNNEQLLRLKDALDAALCGLTISNDEAVPQQKERDPLEAFITAKRIEGCSEKTLTYYRKTIEVMTAETGKMAQQITTDDLRKYLTNYQTTRKSSKVTIDNGYGHKLNELNVRIACAIPFLDIDDTTTLSQFCSLLRYHAVISADEEGYLCSDDYEALIQAIQTSHYVISSYSNDRLIRQSGSFIVPTAIKIIENSTNIGDSLIRKSNCDLDGEFDDYAFIIPQDKKESIREQLDFLNINEATLFPELEHQLIYLQSKKVHTTFSVEPYEQYIRSQPNESHEDESITEVSALRSSNEPHPDINKIVSHYIDSKSVLYKDIISIIKSITSVIDWWLKESAISQMRRDITRLLQKNMSALESKTIANNIVILLSNPGVEYSLEETAD